MEVFYTYVDNSGDQNNKRESYFMLHSTGWAKKNRTVFECE